MKRRDFITLTGTMATGTLTGSLLSPVESPKPKLEVIGVDRGREEAFSVATVVEVVEVEKETHYRVLHQELLMVDGQLRWEGKGK